MSDPLPFNVPCEAETRRQYGTVHLLRVKGFCCTKDGRRLTNVKICRLTPRDCLL